MPEMASKMRALANEAKWRGFWGTIRAIKLNKMGTMHCFGMSFKNIIRLSVVTRNASSQGLVLMRFDPSKHSSNIPTLHGVINVF